MDIRTGADLASAALHAVGFALALLLGLRASAVADSGAGQRITAAFVAAWLLLFAASSLYHALPKDRAYSAVLLAGDHGGIFLLIAACYTPLALVMPKAPARRLIALVWGIGGAGVAAALVAFGAGFGTAFDRHSWIAHLIHAVAPIVLLGRVFFPRVPREVHVCFFASLFLDRRLRFLCGRNELGSAVGASRLARGSSCRMPRELPRSHASSASTPGVKGNAAFARAHPLRRVPPRARARAACLVRRAR